MTRQPVASAQNFPRPAEAYPGCLANVQEMDASFAQVVLFERETYDFITLSVGIK